MISSSSSALCGRCAVSAARSCYLRSGRLFDDAVVSSSISSKLFASKGARSYPAVDNNAIVRLFLPASSSRISRRYYASSKHKRPPSAAPLPPSTTESATATTSLSSDVNPPPSTRPADLDLPPPLAPSATLRDRFSRYLAVGRAYYTFYKTGLKNVYHNYRASIPIRRALGLPVYLPTSPPPVPGTSGAVLDSAVTTLNVSRADLQLVRRAAYDVRRMIPFTLILIVCGEMTPLVVLALGNAVTPLTCRVPGQVDKERLARAKAKQVALQAVQGSLGSATPIPPGSDEELAWLADTFANRDFVASASAEQVLRVCAVFGLTRSLDRPAWLVPWIYRRRLRKWIEYLALDDQLIVRGGGVQALNAEEVRTAVEERGGFGVSGPAADGWSAEREERRWLERWLRRRKYI